MVSPSHRFDLNGQVDRPRRVGFHALWCHPGAALGDDDVPLVFRKKALNRKGMVGENLCIPVHMYVYIYICIYFEICIYTCHVYIYI